MDMYISNNRQLFVSTPFPYSPEFSAIKFHDSVSEAIWIHVIIKEELFNPASASVGAPQ